MTIKFQNLQVDLQAALYGDFEEIVLGMMMKPVEYDAHCLHEAVSGLGTDEAVLIAILSNRTGKVTATSVVVSLGCNCIMIEKN